MNTEFLKIAAVLLPPGGVACYGDTALRMTHPTKDCLYIKILKTMACGREMTIDDVYSSIPGMRRSKTWDRQAKRTVDSRRWCNHSIFGCLKKGGYIDTLPKHKYKISRKGELYLEAVCA